jgi:hypothetical protein
MVLAFHNPDELYIPSIDLIIQNKKAIRPTHNAEIVSHLLAKIWKMRKKYGTECWENKKNYNELEFHTRVKNDGISITEGNICIPQADRLLYLFNKSQGYDSNTFCMFEIDEEPELREKIHLEIANLIDEIAY